jgi:hypothetical protein
MLVWLTMTASVFGSGPPSSLAEHPAEKAIIAKRPIESVILEKLIFHPPSEFVEDNDLNSNYTLSYQFSRGDRRNGALEDRGIVVQY